LRDSFCRLPVEKLLHRFGAGKRRARLASSARCSDAQAQVGNGEVAQLALEDVRRHVGRLSFPQ
jgi:hypothetical protein